MYMQLARPLSVIGLKKLATKMAESELYQFTKSTTVTDHSFEFVAKMIQLSISDTFLKFYPHATRQKRYTGKLSCCNNSMTMMYAVKR